MSDFIFQNFKNLFMLKLRDFTAKLQLTTINSFNLHSVI